MTDGAARLIEESKDAYLQSAFLATPLRGAVRSG